MVNPASERDGRLVLAGKKSSNKTLSRRASSQVDRRQSKNARLPLGKRTLRATRSTVKETAVAYTKSRTCMQALTVATLASCLFYIIGTYLEDETIIIAIEAVFSVIFLLDYLLSLAAAPIPLRYVFSVEGLIDICSVVAVLGAFRRWIFSFSFIRYLRLGKALRIIRSHRLLGRINEEQDIHVRIALLGIKVSGLILMTTAIIYGLEQAVEDESTDEGAFNEPTMQWHDALYYTVVTLSTVGYGDVLPVQTLSRILIVLVILFAFTYVPLEVNNLVEVISSRPRYRAGFSPSLLGRHLHVIIAMVPQGDEKEMEFDAESLARCMDELFHEDHGVDNEVLWVVVMAPSEPSPEVLGILRSPRFMSRVIYYRGTVMDPRDMAAVCAEYADCIFLCSNSQPTDNDQHTEERTLLAAKSLQRYLTRTPTDPGIMEMVERLSIMGVPCRTVVTVKDLHSKDQLLRFGIDHVICHDELKLSMLACGTLCPAFLPFVINIMRSSSLEELSSATRKAPTAKEEEKYLRRTSEMDTLSSGRARESEHVHRQKREGNWLKDYMVGTGYEVYSLPLLVTEKSRLFGMSFGRVALELYERSEGVVLLMGVVMEFEGDTDEDHGESGRVNASEREARDRESIRKKNSRRPSVMPPSLRRKESDTAGGTRRKSKSNDTVSQPFIHASIFPAQGFQFGEECYVLVLAEDKRHAEHHILELQVEPSADSCPRRTLASTGASVRPGDESAAPRGDAEGASASKVSRDEGHDVDGPVEAPPAGFGSTISKLFPTSEEKADAEGSSEDAPSRRLAQQAPADGDDSAPITKGNVKQAVMEEGMNNNDDLEPESAKQDAREHHAAEGAVEAAKEQTVQQQTTASSVSAEGMNTFANDSGEANQRPSGSAGIDIGDLSFRAADLPLVPNLSTSNRAKDSPRSVTSGSSSVGGGAFRHRKRGTSSMPLTDEQRVHLESVREETRQEDGVKWVQVLDELKRATSTLTELKSEGFTEERVGADPSGFFAKVEKASQQISKALRIHTSALPVDLEGHLVLVGSHSRLEHYILALRRQRPSIPIVVVTDDSEMFFDLRERLAEYKFDERTLNISRIFHVFGRTQDRHTFNEARISKAEAVVLMSDRSDDSEVLLTSFELEQLLSEVQQEDIRPKVVIDLRKDSSIYYCGHALGSGGLSLPGIEGNNSGRLEELATLTSADVWEWPLFAAGRVWTESIMDVFAMQTYFSVEILAFLETILQIRRPVLVGQSLVDTNAVTGNNECEQVDGDAADGSTAVEVPIVSSSGHGESAAGGGETKSAPKRGQFDQLRVSYDFEGKTYGELARHLISKGAMPLGLYRPAGTKRSKLPYTHVNPPMCELLKTWPRQCGLRRVGRVGGGQPPLQGDNVFVLRSRTCQVYGTVGLS